MEERYRLLVESIKDYAIFTLDGEGHVTSWNAGAQRFKQYRPDEIIGRHFSVFYPPEDVAGGKPARELEVAAREGRIEDEGWRVRKDGTRFWANVVITALRENGRLVGYAKVTRDLTERMQNEERLRAAVTELDAFAYSVSHDLRAPLRSIDGFSQLLLEDYAEKLDDAGKEALARVRAATQRMGGLIDDLLKLSRVSRGELRQETVDLSALAAGITQEFTGRNDVHITIAPGLVVQGDARLLRIALENLLGNAWKYTSKRSDARIEFGAQGKPGGGERVFYVRDNGAGFDMQYADKLFGAFQRLHGATEFEGTGVGLATVQRILRRHGGRIWAEAKVDEGATFYFTVGGGDGGA